MPRKKNNFPVFTRKPNMSMSVLTRIQPHYTPSYVTYPPSILQLTRSHSKSSENRYPIALRIILKVIELVRIFFFKINFYY